MNCLKNHVKSPQSTAKSSTAGGLPVIQSVSSLAGSGDMPQNPTQPLPPTQLNQAPVSIQTQTIR